MGVYTGSALRGAGAERGCILGILHAKPQLPGSGDPPQVPAPQWPCSSIHGLAALLASTYVPLPPRYLLKTAQHVACSVLRSCDSGMVHEAGQA